MKLKITVDGKLYEVDVEVAEDDAPPLYAPAGASVSAPLPAGMPVTASSAVPPAGSAGEDKICRSPIAGVVVRVAAQPGQQIQVNDPLLVLEAMKMETNITSPVTARIKAIPVAGGDAVQVGQVLVEFD